DGLPRRFAGKPKKEAGPPRSEAGQSAPRSINGVKHNLAGEFLILMKQRDIGTIGILIVAAGRGERAGSSAEGPKQYRLIGGRPVITHTLERFVAWPHSGPIVVVIHPDDEALFEKSASLLAHRPEIRTVHGAATRQGSVLAGLEAMQDLGATHVMI